MNLLADESVDRPIVDALRQDGHAVRYIAEMDLGVSDDVVLDLANQEADLLLTADEDFGEMVFRRGLFTRGTLLIRPAGQSPQEKAQLVASVVDEHAAELPGAFAVLTTRSLRIRRLG